MVDPAMLMEALETIYPDIATRERHFDDDNEQVTPGERASRNFAFFFRKIQKEPNEASNGIELEDSSVTIE